MQHTLSLSPGFVNSGLNDDAMPGAPSVPALLPLFLVVCFFSALF
jgi:hypothetical protein